MADLNVQVVPGSTNVTVQDANNIQLNVTPPTNVRVEVEPVANQVIEINRGVQGAAGEGVPAGGTTGQALVKTSDANYDTEWSNTVPNAETADHATTADSATLAGNVTGIVAVVNGGTGADNATDARTNLGAAQSGTNADITSMTDLTGGISTPDFVQFDTAAAAGINLGKLRWNTTSNTLAFGIIDGTDEINIGEQMVAYVANADSVTITRGQPVYLYAAQGNRASVKLASNLGDPTSAKTLGLAMQDIAPNNAGFVMTQGVLDKVNTGAFTEGVTLYLGATAGTLTATKPKAPNHLVYIGVVERSNSGNGQIYVKPQNGYELDEIHDVQITSPVNGQTIIYDQSTSLWKNANLTAGTGVTITNGPSSIVISAPDNGTVTSVAATGGTGISVSGSPITTSGTFTITNTAPDQTVVLNAGTGISTSGTYPNFTITNTSPSSGGTVTSVNTAGTVNGLTLTGGPITSSGTITLGGTLDLSSPPAIGGTTPAAGTFTTLIGGGGSANYFQTQGSATTKAVEVKALGSDTNIAFVIDSKGTGAIDLATGSSGVNISNGGTVTAITRTVVGSGYTSIPSVVISAPTTAGGVQATATAIMETSVGATIASGGTGYTVGDVLSVVGGTSTTTATYTVATVSTGVITGLNPTIRGSYTVLPSSPVSLSGGTGTGATLNLTWAVTSFTITNAGSGYVEQPTVSFSGGGGSGAAAYATVGSQSRITSIGAHLELATPNGIGLRVSNSGVLNVNYPSVQGSQSTGSVYYGVVGSDTDIGAMLVSKGAGSVRFMTNNSAQEQMRVAHTASAVNYVQVTGNVTTGQPVISAQGSDASIGLAYRTKGTFFHYFQNGSNQSGFVVSPTGSANYLQASSANATAAPTLSAAGSDTNISQVFQSKGTGAIDLAAGSSGVNISNGGTVTAITRTAAGSAYTSPPALTVSAPTTAGGVQATATAYLGNIIVVPTITSGGTGYAVNDVLTLSGGTFLSASTLTVTAVSGGVITAITVATGGAYSVIPTGTISVTGGTGTGATFTISSWGVSTTFTITNAGSGYVEQPTVSFSGGGGSGAAAYATVGSGTVIRALGATGTQSLDIYTPSSITTSNPAFRFRDSTNADSYPMVWNFAGSANLIAQGNTNAQVILGSNGTGPVRFTTNGTSTVDQLRVAHTASAVNYVQVTGAATTAPPVISAQGSDTNISLRAYSKGTGVISFWTAAGSSRQFQVDHVTGTVVNYVSTGGSVTGAAPYVAAGGTDTNIDLTLTPKGTGVVQFGTHTATVDLAVTGYITIRDAGGTLRKLAVIP